jgi:tetratricopeptide (TPR) repeat protein
MSPAHVDEAWQAIDEATAIAERLGDAGVIVLALAGLSGCQRLCCEFEASVVSARRALPALGSFSAAQQANLFVNLLMSEYYLGHFATSEGLLPELKAAAGRAGHHGALWVHDRVQQGIALARTGDIGTFLAHARALLAAPHFKYVNQSAVATCDLYFGAVDEALGRFEAAVAEQPTDHYLQGMPEANVFAAAALSGQHDRATTLIAPLAPFLPVAGRRNVHGAFLALEALVTGLAVIGDRERLGALYPLASAYVQTGQKFMTFVVGPSNPQLTAALSAGAVGLGDKAREHFETALRQAHDVPLRILQPSVLYWYGRSLATATDGAERARGRAMVEAALTDFRALGMVLHTGLAEQFLRHGPPASPARTRAF